MVRTQHCCDTWPGSGDNSEVSTTRGHQAVRRVMCRDMRKGSEANGGRQRVSGVGCDQCAEMRPG